MKRFITYSSAIAIGVAALLVPLGCSTDAPDGGDCPGETAPAEVAFKLSSPFNRTATRGDSGTPTSPSDNEKIIDWFLVFVDSRNTVCKILSREDVISSSTFTPVEEETFRCILPTGTYSVYAFANISAEELEKATEIITDDTHTLGYSFEIDKALDLDKLNKALWRTGLNGRDVSAEKPIPMTGYLGNIKVENTIEESFSIEVVRMLAKVEVRFTNPTDKKITVKSVGIDPVTVSPITLFPDAWSEAGINYDFLGDHAYTPHSGAAYSRFDFTPTEALDVAAGDKDKSLTFYIQESLSQRANNKAFTIWINVTHEGGVANVEQHNITSDILSYINRNDWIVLPVTLSSYNISMEAIFYPPIGGYPAYLSTTDPEGAQVFTFGTPGDFAIVPHITDKITGSPLSPARYKLSIVDNTVSDPEGIFKTIPAVTETLSAIPDEILGELSQNEGKASLTVKVDIYDKPATETDAKVTDSYTRTLFIIRDNDITPN